MKQRAKSEPQDFFSSYQQSLRTRSGRSRRTHGGPVVATLVLVGALALLAWVGSTIFTTPGQFRNEYVQVTIHGPSDVQSANTAEYTVEVMNKNKTPLSDVTLTTEYPLGFHFIDSTPSPSNTKHTYWSIGVLKGGENFPIRIRGTLIGGSQEGKEIRAIVTYRPISLNAEFTATAIKTTRIVGSSLTLDVHGSERASISDGVSYTVSVPIFEAFPAKDQLVLRAVFPDRFKVTGSSHKATRANAEWALSALAGNPLTINGIYEEGASGTQQIAFTLGVLSNNEFTPLDQKIIRTELDSPSLVLSLSAYDHTEHFARTYGPPLRYRIAYHNKSSMPLQSVTLEATFTSEYIDFARSTELSGAIIHNRTLRWTQQELPELRRLQPDQQGFVDLAIVLKDTRAAGKIAGNNRVSAQVSASFGNTRVSGPTLDITLNSDSTLSTRLEQIEEQRPQPTVRVVWRVDNSLHEISDLAIAGTLAGPLKWNNETSVRAGEISYDEQTRTITWKLNRLPISVSSIENAFTVAFGEKLNPTEQQDIITNLTFTARDSVTSEKIILRAAPLTTASLE